MTFYLHSLQLTPFTVLPLNVRVPSVSSAVQTTQDNAETAFIGLIVYAQSGDVYVCGRNPLNNGL